jgi:NAD(P)-dependent dehydrogenase (short-subunit alcohol dehydrogenase family)
VRRLHLARSPGNPAAIKARSRDADVVAFLASPAARWITGVFVAIDGGLSLRKHPELLAPPGSDAG